MSPVVIPRLADADSMIIPSGSATRRYEAVENPSVGAPSSSKDEARGGTNKSGAARAARNLYPPPNVAPLWVTLQVQKALKGQVVLSAELEAMGNRCSASAP